MASVNLNVPINKEWLLARPWLWLSVGFAFTLWSWVWTLAFGAIASDYRVIVLAIGLLATGVGVWMRWSDRQSIYLRLGRLPVVALGCFFGLLGMGIGALFVASFFTTGPTNLRPGPLFLVLITAGPPAFYAARRCLKPNLGEERSGKIEEENSLAFLAAAVVCLLGSFTLYAGRSVATDWDTIRLFLRVVCAVALFASALTLASKRLRRLMLSAIFLIHFGGIATAVLAQEPAPWLIKQVWMRVYRPYLQFLYLQNAYHFYAPEPGPASYVWFRVIYTAPDQKDYGFWYKFPQLDDKGRIQHPVALEYQRFMSLTDGVGYAETPPSQYYFNKEKQAWDWSPLYKNRLMPNAGTVGVESPKQLMIPLDPSLPYSQQIWVPNANSRQMLTSFAQFIGRKYAVHPDVEKSDWKFKSVKIYRVVHWIPPIQWFQNHIPPTDPSMYRAAFLGNFRADGTRIEDQNPYLYWLLPAIRKDSLDPDSAIWDFVRLHAGDPHWFRRRKETRWVEPNDDELPFVTPPSKEIIGNDAKDKK